MSQQLTYAEEQSKLQRQVDGDDLRITPPKEPEVNPEIYRDVEPLLYRGFLTQAANINGVSFVFKSLNHHEFELLRFTGVLKPSEQDGESLWDMFLAYGIFMVQGVNILADRDRHLSKLAETFGSMTVSARQRVIRHLSEINRRASNAVVLTEAYAMESYSRYRWAQYRHLSLTSPDVTGIEGTHRLGMNWAQLTWRAMNYFEDRHDEHEREWENAKFIGSCMAGKGISKVYNQDHERRRKEKEERMARKDRILRQIVLGEKPQDKVKQLGYAQVVAARSVEELSHQLEGDLKGEKDWHDQVIQSIQDRARIGVQAQREQQEQLAKDYEAQFGTKTVIGGTGLEGLTPEEVRLRIERQKQMEAQSAARRMVHPELHDPKLNAFLDKWGVGEEVATSVSSTDRDPSEAVEIPPTRQRGVPFGRR